MRYTLVMTRVKIEYMLFAAMSLVAGAENGPGPDFECKRSVVCRLRMPAGFVLLVFL